MVGNIVKEILNILVRVAIIAVVIVVLLTGVKWAYQSAYEIMAQKPADEVLIKDVVFEVKKGATTEQIANQLEKGGLINNALYFRIMSKLTGSESKFQVGTFHLTTNMDDEQIIDILQTEGNKKKTVRFTIPEGFTIQQIAKRLAKLKLCTEEEFMTAVNQAKYDYDFVGQIPTESNRKVLLQGYLFPNTYEVYQDAGAEYIVSMMLKQFDTVFNQTYKERLKTMDMSIDDIITIASIIEKEVRVPDERSKVAGVIYNRLKIDMPLQMCSTVMFVLDKRRDRLTISDTKIESDYNTYIHSGLPVGPICNPGKAAIEAALYPEESDYLFFVLQDPETGEHEFSQTLEEHNKAKAKYNQRF